MDNSNFGSSHLSSPALVVFSQAANGLSDALRLQRPFHSQLQDAKDLHHLSLVSSYGTHLLHGFQPHFLHQHLNPAVSSASSPFGSGGAFVKPFPSNISLPSAFQPPKCLGFGLDQFSKFKGLLFGSGNNSTSTGGGGSESFRTDSSSPACASLSPPAKDESMEGHTSEEGDRDRICSPSRSPETPGFRRIGPKKPMQINTQSATGHNSCPICGIQLSLDELDQHYSSELQRLAKPNMYNERQEIRRTLSMELHAVQGSLQSRTSRWETFQRIRVNRQGRLRGKLRKRKFEEEAYANMTCQSCPVCHGRLQRTQEEIAQHIEECVRKQNSHSSQMQDEDETVDVESYGEETSNGAINMTSQNHHFNNSNNNNNNNNNSINNNNISNQVINNNNNNNNNTIMHSKIDKTTPEDHHTITSLNRAATNWDHKSRMSLNMNCTTQINENAITRVTPTSSDQRIDVEYELDNERDQSQERMSDNEEELIVDNTDDENDCNGLKRKLPQQPPSAQRIVNGLREMKKSTEEATSSVEIDSATESNNHTIIRTPNDTTPNSDSYVSTSETIEPPASKAQVLEELKARIRELEGSPHYKCFMCKEKCKTFIISTICGHYLCEDCWITVSDIEKQCPRCKITTLNIDFRKISCLN
ncbi:unnamed protein product [Chironomus riparius]|uniref:RING-type domain-containing protein n=1 Tax=Chironomus riparius TaxID=315576 RepID=A0A9N9WRZ4_9DIPT|nr:unnamed protein product [Chironomus riparius]